MQSTEYLLGYGKLGHFGRFQVDPSWQCRRGECFVIESPRGLEIGTVIRALDQGPRQFLGQSFAGRIVRRITHSDEAAQHRCRERAEALFAHGRVAANELGLPLEIVDAEVLLLDEPILHVLRWAPCDPRGLLDHLGGMFRSPIRVSDLASAPQDELHGCAGDCGSGGGCGSCSSGGCATCAVPAVDRASRAATKPVADPHAEGARVSLV
jgi:hypothetical protein